MPWSRRRVILSTVVLGGGLAVVAGLRRLDDGDARRKFAAGDATAVALNAWIRIAPDGWVTFGIHRAEMGQGVTTALAMLLAEELDADWARVRYEFTPLDKDYFNFGILAGGRPFGPTEGRPLAGAGTAALRSLFRQLGLSVTIASSSTIDAWDTLRTAAAEARWRLVAAAAAALDAPGARLTTAGGRVTDPDTGRQLDYGALAADAARLVPGGGVPPKPASAFRLLGTSPPRLDVPAKVAGTERYGIDHHAPDMLFGAVCHAPRVGGRLAPVDATPALAVPGVLRVVPILDRAVAVLATDTWAAQRGAARLDLVATSGPALADTASLYASYRADLDRPEPSVFVTPDGEPPAAASGREAVYELPLVAHACLEPMNCSARYGDGRLVLWAPTQAPTLVRDEAAKYTGLAGDAIDVRQMSIGGGFGRRADVDYAIEAAVVAMAVPGRTVKLTWSRAEDLRHDMFRPMAVGRVRGSVDAAGRIASIDYTLVSESVVASNNRRTPSPRGGDAAKDRTTLSGAIDHPYAIPWQRFAYVPRDDGIPVGFWRSVSASINPFLLESFIDELALAAATDPLEFRRRHLTGRARELSVLDAVARLAGWGTPLPAGAGRGLALGENHGAVAALVAEVAPADGGRLRVARISAVVDVGFAIHPANVEAQVTGGILDGYRAACFPGITLAGGAVEQANFDAFPWPRLAEVPPVNVVLLTPGGRPAGVGEVGVPLVAPALANAVAAATGRRHRRLPLPDGLA